MNKFKFGKKIKKGFRLKHFLINSDERFKLGFIGIIVGVTSSLAAVGLTKGLGFFHHFFGQIENPLITIFLPAIGLLLTVILLKYVINDFGGHGLPEVIHSISLKGGIIKFRSAYSKLLGSLITISFGGSAGPEAPIVVSGAAIGSNVARLFRANEKIRIAVAGSGAAAAIASIFNAPIAGIIFTMEVIIGEWTPIFLLPIVIASVTGTEISRLLNGNQIQFSHELIKVNVNDIFLSVFLALVCAFFSILFIRTVRNSSKFMDKYFKNILIKALVGGLIIGLISLNIPYVKGEGYKFVQDIITGHFTNGLLFVLLIIVLKIVATSITLGAGGSGGVFAPSLVIGSSTGLFFYMAIRSLFPELAINEAALYALVGMAGVLSGTLNAPLTGMFLIIEISNGYDAILPLMLVSFLTSAIVKQFEPHSIYHYELVKKGHLHRPRTDGKILAEISPRELLEKDLSIVYPDILLSDLIPKIKKSNRNYFPVVDRESGNLLGMVYFNDIKDFIFDNTLINSILVEEVMHTDLTTISTSDSLTDIQKKFEQTNSWSLPVVENQKYKGLISKATMLDLYRKELKVQTEI
ncbi:MAG: chloride channel protein [Calditrichaeota bacterium]|nr:MAG: CBS domain-containing protein [Calditrichota bacterium]MBL1204915.1 chloride channel protein [Calditrichota bacterium]NOG44744.1 chloride channel protein [Calditrichota bacterium]